MVDIGLGAVAIAFEPKIIGLLCNWCSYSAADGAGAARHTYPANLYIIRVNCSGRVDPSLVMQAFRDGADGVLVCGCHPGDCHYVDGNLRAVGRMALLERVVASLGLEAQRFRFEWVSASEGEKFAAIVSEMVEQVRALGPLAWPDCTDSETEALVHDE